MTLADARRKLAGWHFAQEALTAREREILHVGEAVLRETDDWRRLALDMGEELRAWAQWSIESFGADEEVPPTTNALLARLEKLDGIANKDKTT